MINSDSSPPVNKEKIDHLEPFDHLNLENLELDSQILSLLPAELVSRTKSVPVKLVGETLYVAMENPKNLEDVESLSHASGKTICRLYASSVGIQQCINKYYGSNVSRLLEGMDSAEESPLELNKSEFTPEKLQEMAKEPSLINLVNLMLLEAIEVRASDIHIEPFENDLKMRYRVDGVLVERPNPSKNMHAAIISRIKILAEMDIAECFVPQDGHIEFDSQNGKVDIRVSTIPSVYGESVVMRILERSGGLASMSELGMEISVEGAFTQCLGKSHGIILVTGPTGSGKTTTLYQALKKVYSPDRKVITIEDPVEYRLDGVVQMPVNTKRGLTFAKGLRHILRQDPDIVMIGEIRDTETADIAVRAALTGHLVLSTLHTNDAAGAVTRLIDMGIEPFLLASALEVVLAQRLIRKICSKCKQSYNANAIEKQQLENHSDTPLFKGIGCESCLQTGYSGRQGIFELLEVTPLMRPLISQCANADDLLKHATEHHVFMREDGLRKVLKGEVTLDEVMRVTQG